MKNIALASLLVLSACTAAPPQNNPNEPTTPDATDYRSGTCSVNIQFEAFAGTVTGQSRYTYDVESPLKDLHYVECVVAMQQIGNTIVDSTWRFYIRSDTLTQGVQGTFERVEGKSDDLAYLISFNLVDYETSRRTSYNFRTEGYTASVTLQQNQSGYRGSFSEKGNFTNSSLTDKAGTINATFNGQ
jgi:hypothetical protein